MQDELQDSGELLVWCGVLRPFERLKSLVYFGYYVVGARTKTRTADIRGGELESVEKGAGARQV